MTPRSVHSVTLAELPPAAQQRVQDVARTATLPGGSTIQLGPNSPLPSARGARRSSSRKRSGTAFELELERTHAIYLRRGLASLRQHHPKVVGAPGAMRYAEGGAPCDFGGAAVIWGALWPILFDAKGIGDHAIYRHDPQQIHQLDELLEHRALGGIAFLLLRDPSRGLAYVIWEPQDLETLRLGVGVMVRSGRSKAMEHLKPHFHQDPASGTWDWLTCLERSPMIEAMYASPRTSPAASPVHERRP